jgi:purine catabolism regulator
VTWATRLRPAAPAFGHLAGGELVLLAAGVLELIDERLTLDEAVRQLAVFGVAAVAHAGRVPPEAIVAADAAGLPLLVLPAAADLGELEREAARSIIERRRAIQRRGQEVGRRLMELAIAGESMAATVRSLAELAGRAVALEGVEGRLLAYHAPEPPPDAVRQTTAESTRLPPALAAIEPALSATHPALAGWLRAMAASSPADPPTAASELDERWNRIVAPVIGRDGLLGSLSLLVPRGTETPEDGLLTSRGAAACAVVLAREQATASVRREVELNVLDEVLDGALRSEVSLLQQARRLGHDLEASHVALVARLEPAGTRGPALARSREDRWAMVDEALARAGAGRDHHALWRVRSNAAEVVWPATTAIDVRRIARTLRDELAQLAPNGPGGPEAVSLGFGRLRGGLEGIRRSHQEARQALTLGRRLHGPGHLTAFDDLGVYRLIFAAEGLPELRTFHDETLDALTGYDRQHGADLLRTLEAFFRANCSPKEASALLGVHRNTVLYRLDRIAEITGLALDDADVRLRLQLALHVHLALFAGGE